MTAPEHASLKAKAAVVAPNFLSWQVHFKGHLRLPAEIRIRFLPPPASSLFLLFLLHFKSNSRFPLFFGFLWFTHFLFFWFLLYFLFLQNKCYYQHLKVLTSYILKNESVQKTPYAVWLKTWILKNAINWNKKNKKHKKTKKILNQINITKSFSLKYSDVKWNCVQY